jgi:26S proteasome regulatory subunit T1
MQCILVCPVAWKFGNVLFKGIKESDTGLAPPALWDLAADKQALHSEQPLQVNKIVQAQENSKVSYKQI